MAMIRSPGVMPAPGAASGDSARGSDDSPGRILVTRQPPSGSRSRSAPSMPTGRRLPWFPDEAGWTYACDEPSSPITS